MSRSRLKIHFFVPAGEKNAFLIGAGKKNELKIGNGI
jgi:hypothetical protein